MAPGVQPAESDGAGPARPVLYKMLFPDFKTQGYLHLILLFSETMVSLQRKLHIESQNTLKMYKKREKDHVPVHSLDL